MFCEDSSGFRAKPATRFGTTSKNGRFTPEYPAGFSRNGWQVYTGIGGRVRTEFSIWGMHSARETGGVEDQNYMTSALTAFFEEGA